MKYRNTGGQPREKAMVAAYALVTKFGANQADVGKVLGCSQPTVANWVKEMGYRKEINGLKNELSSAQEYIDYLAEEMKLIGYDPSAE
jgi:predicted transcriptional regulator